MRPSQPPQPRQTSLRVARPPWRGWPITVWGLARARAMPTLTMLQRSMATSRPNSTSRLIDDSACEATLAQFYAVHGKDPNGGILPPLNATTRQIKTYLENAGTGFFAPGELSRLLVQATIYVRCTAHASSTKLWSTSGAITLIRLGWRANTNSGKTIMLFGGMRWAISAICWGPAPKAPRCWRFLSNRSAMAAIPTKTTPVS